MHFYHVVFAPSDDRTRVYFQTLAHNASEAMAAALKAHPEAPESAIEEVQISQRNVLT